MQKYRNILIQVDGKKFNAIVADSFLKKMIGLMFRKKINNNECMLFVFGNESRYAIWMHNMLFPIDVAWINSKFRVVDIKENLNPCKLIDCKEYYPTKPAKYIMEFKSGALGKKRIKIGSKVDLSKL
jgi:uncharacterized protein